MSRSEKTATKIVELITIGNEILDGRVTDTNRVYLGRELKNLGFEVRYAQSVDDDQERIVDAFTLAASRSDLIFCTGGLGPTSDDITAEAFAKFLDVPYLLDSEAEKFVRKVLTDRKREANPSQLKQAYLAEGCKMLFNPIGTAPGFSYAGKLSQKNVSFYFFPGIPHELHAIFEKEVLPIFQSAAEKGLFRTYTWSTIFTAESDLQERLKAIEAKILPLKLGFRTQFPENFVSLMGEVENADEKKWEEARSAIDKVLAPLSYQSQTTYSFEEKLLKELAARRARLLLVESCTGGLLSHLLTQVAGASSVVWGSQVCYANEEKFRLGVDPKIIEEVGAVSEECALAMAEQGLERLCKDSVNNAQLLLSLSTTGIAGPGGATERKPVGLFYIGLACKNLQSGELQRFHEKILAPQFYDRQTMKLYMAKKALEFLRVNILIP